MNSRLGALAIVLLTWALIYLPSLGSIAIKGEEGRRILPAIRMLETGNYIVPQVGSNPYYRKPPLVNWLVAATFKISGVRNEWTARLPSVLAVLAVAMAFVTIARPSLGPRGSIVAALIWMTNIGMIEKGRLIEIEALYVSLCGLAIIFWLSFWDQKKSPWLIWTPASVFLGIGLLAKGPTHLVFFYAIVLAVLWHTKDWRLLFHPAHFVGLAIMLAIPAAWAIPFVQRTTTETAVDKWSAQFTGRLRGIDFKFFSSVSVRPFFKISGSGAAAFCTRAGLGNRSAVCRSQSGSGRCRSVQHAGDSSRLLVAGDDLRRRRIAVAPKSEEERSRLGHGCGGFYRAGHRDRCDWLPAYRSRFKKQAAGEESRRRDQRAGACE